MATIKIHKVLRVATAGTVTATENATIVTSVFAVGDEFLTVDGVLAKLNTDLAAVVTFAQSEATGVITATPTGSTFDVEWGTVTGAMDYLGYVGDFDEASPTATTQPVGYWSGQAAVPWNVNPREMHADVVSRRGRTNTVGQYGTKDGTITLWGNTAHVDATFEANMARMYAVVSQWADAHLSIEDSTGYVTSPFFLAEGYAFEPQLLDKYMVQVDVGVTLCLE